MNQIWGFSGGFALVFIGVFVWMLVRYRQAIATLESLGQLTSSWNPDEENPNDGGATHELVSHLHPLRHVNIDADHRFLLREDRREVLESYAEKGRPLAIASMWTGAALILTFGMIGWVLYTNVTGAIRSFSVGDGAEAGQAGANALSSAGDQLANAVQAMGGKFWISAIGVFASIIYSILTLVLDKKLSKTRDDVEWRWRKVFASPDEFDGLVQRRQLDALVDIRQQGLQLDATQARIVGKLEEVREGLDKLTSIEVSVQDLSSELMERAKNMLTVDLGNRIEAIAQNALVEAGRVAEGIGVGIADVVRTTSETHVPQVLTHLERIEQSVAKQAQSPVEALLERMKGALSQGYSAESDQLARSMAGFANSIPQLTSTLEAVSSRVGSSLADQERRSADTTDRLLQRVDGLLSKLDTHQDSLEKSIGTVTHSAEAATVSLSQAIEIQARRVADSFGDAAESHRAKYQETISKNAQLNSATLDQMERSLAASVSSLESLQSGLSASALAMRDVAAISTSTVTDAQRANASARDASVSLAAESKSLRTLVTDVTRLLGETAQQANSGRALTEEQRKVLEQMQQLWPTLFQTYIQSFEEKSKQLATSWKSLANEIAQTVTTVAEPLKDAAEELTDAVDRLAKTAKG